MKEFIGIIGFGNMGQAIAERIKGGFSVYVFDKEAAKTIGLSGINAASGISELLDKSRTIILAVKPQDLEGILKEIRSQAKAKLIISIAAGIASGYIEKCLGQIRVIRAMPNLAAKVGQGLTCLSKGRFAEEKDLAFAEAIFSHIGKILRVDEKMMDAATAVSGSGPGFFFALVKDKDKKDWREYALKVFKPKLSEAAIKLGFSLQDSEILAAATTQGSLALLDISGLTAKDLCIQVASKGGTTEAGLEILDKGGSIEEAVKAALERAGELSKKE